MTNVGPNSGGCWYCGDNEGDMVLSAQFDTFLHIECLKAAILAEPGDLEAEILREEFGIKDE